MIYIASDHAGYESKLEILEILNKLGEVYIDLTPNFNSNDDYPLVAKDMARNVKNGDLGFLSCGSGRGICMAANKFKNIRGCYVENSQDTKLVKLDNNANIICLPGKYSKNKPTKKELSKIVAEFINTKYIPDSRKIRRLNQIVEF